MYLTVFTAPLRARRCRATGRQILICHRMIDYPHVTLAVETRSLSFMRHDRLLFPLLALILVGCGTQRFTLKHSPLPAPADKRAGSLSVQFTDKREDKQRIGVFKGGYGNKLGDIITTEDLESSLTRIFTEVLERAGYSVVPGARVTLEGEIREFRVEGNGWSQNAKERIRVRLRDKEGQIFWEKSLMGEDGGMQFGASSYEKSMNKALDRLLSDAVE